MTTSTLGGGTAVDWHTAAASVYVVVVFVLAPGIRTGQLSFVRPRIDPKRATAGTTG